MRFRPLGLQYTRDHETGTYWLDWSTYIRAELPLYSFLLLRNCGQTFPCKLKSKQIQKHRLVSGLREITPYNDLHLTGVRGMGGSARRASFLRFQVFEWVEVSQV